MAESLGSLYEFFVEFGGVCFCDRWRLPRGQGPEKWTSEGASLGTLQEKLEKSWKSQETTVV